MNQKRERDRSRRVNLREKRNNKNVPDPLTEAIAKLARRVADNFIFELLLIYFEIIELELVWC